MPIVGGLDIHRKQITFDYLDTVTGEVKRGQIAPADREHVRAWLARFAGWDDVAFAVEGTRAPGTSSALTTCGRGYPSSPAGASPHSPAAGSSYGEVANTALAQQAALKYAGFAPKRALKNLEQL